jgi:hypothetical protein
MKITLLLSALLITALLAGCGEPEADISNPKTHSSGAITLDYPKHWKISGESVTPAIHSFTIKTDGGALVIFQSYPSETADDLPTFSKSFSNSFSGHASGKQFWKIAGAPFASVPEADGFEWTEESFTISLFGESAPHRRLYGTKDIEGRRIFLIFQVASADAAKVEPGFQLIRKSLRGNQNVEQ